VYRRHPDRSKLQVKTSFAISWQETEFNAVAKGDAAALINVARSVGYDAVELAVRMPTAVDVHRLREALGGLPVSALGTGQAYLTDHLSLTCHDVGVRKAAIRRLVEHCHLAAELACPLVIIGLIRGKQGDSALLDGSLQEVCAFAESLSIRLVVEPINRYETELVNTAAQALSLIKRVGMKNLGVLLDTFHMNVEEENPSAALTSNGERLWHVHLADSNRLAPGAGHLDFRQILGLLCAQRYDGYVSVEIIPRPDASTAMKRALDTIRWADGNSSTSNNNKEN
jgi:sugar phosphate isomerase/epimerase